MPLYCYKCVKCQLEKTMLRCYKESKISITCECGADMVLQLPKIMAPSVMETADKHRNVQQRKNLNERLKKRAKKFFVEHEVEEIVGKHGVEEAKKMGWIKKGKVVKKSDLS